MAGCFHENAPHRKAILESTQICPLSSWQWLYWLGLIKFNHIFLTCLFTIRGWACMETHDCSSAQCICLDARNISIRTSGIDWKHNLLHKRNWSKSPFFDFYSAALVNIHFRQPFGWWHSRVPNIYAIHIRRIYWRLQSCINVLAFIEFPVIIERISIIIISLNLWLWITKNGYWIKHN